MRAAGVAMMCIRASEGVQYARSRRGHAVSQGFVGVLFARSRQCTHHGAAAPMHALRATATVPATPEIRAPMIMPPDGLAAVNPSSELLSQGAGSVDDLRYQLQGPIEDLYLPVS